MNSIDQTILFFQKYNSANLAALVALLLENISTKKLTMQEENKLLNILNREDPANILPYISCFNQNIASVIRSMF